MVAVSWEPRRKTVLPRHAYGDEIGKIDLCAQIVLNKYQFLH